MKTALLVIATGKKYHQYVQPLMASAWEHFVPHDFLLWTDSPHVGGTQVFHKEAEGYPNETLHRYHTFLTQRSLLETYDQLFYVDVDALFVSKVEPNEIFSAGITATLHPGFVQPRDHQRGNVLIRITEVGTPERRPESTAYLAESCGNKYFCGGFNGGNATEFLKMADTLRQNIDKDATSGITAIWHDESHLNNYLYHNPPTKILTPSYCYPEGYRGQFGWQPEKYNPTLLVLNKGPRQ